MPDLTEDSSEAGASDINGEKFNVVSASAVDNDAYDGDESEWDY